MANKVHAEVVWIRIYADKQSAAPSIADMTGASAMEISKEGLGLQDFNWPREAATRENTGRNGWVMRESQGVIDHNVDFQVDWESPDTDDLLDGESKYMYILRRIRGTGAGLTQALGGGPIVTANLVDRDGGWTFDVTVDGDDSIVRSNQ